MRAPHQLSLAHTDTAQLAALWQELTGMPAKSRVIEEDIASEALRSALGPLLGQLAWVVAAVLEAVLAERSVEAPVRAPDSIQVLSAHARSTLGAAARPPELVWSGATAPRTCARSTRQAIEDLFASVETEVFIAGYSFDHASDLFEPLFAKVRALAAQGRALPSVRIVVDCSRKPRRESETSRELAKRVHDDFLRTCWQDSPLAPELRYLKESAERTVDGYALCSMHAKCIVVDRVKALVGSANFSNRGRDRNLEVGALIHDAHFVAALCAEWDALWPQLAALPETG